MVGFARDSRRVSHTARAGHRLAAASADAATLRRSNPYAKRAGASLPAHNIKNQSFALVFYFVRREGFEPS